MLNSKEKYLALLLVSTFIVCSQQESHFTGRPLRPPTAVDASSERSSNNDIQAVDVNDQGDSFTNAERGPREANLNGEEGDEDEEGAGVGLLKEFEGLVEEEVETIVQDNLGSLVAGNDGDDTGDGPAVAPVFVPLAADEQQQQQGSQSRGAETPDEFENKFTLTRLFHGLYYQVQYSKINNYLVENEPSYEFGANMRKAEEWLEREKSRGVNLFTNKATVEALEQFVALNQIKKRCDRVAYSILWKNDRATKGQAHRRPSKMARALTRVTTIVHRASLEHALDCLNVYPDSYAHIYSTMDSHVVENVERFLAAVIEQHVVAKKKIKFFDSRQLGSTFEPVKLVNDIKSVSGNKIAEIAYEAIDSYSAQARDPNRRFLRKVVDEKRGQMVVDKEGVRQLVKRYLVEPCAYYVRTLGPDVFIPAAYDSRMLEKEDRYRWDGDRVAHLIQGWIRYRLCELVVYKDESRLANGVISVVQKQKDN